jgi:hypothetical protein
MGRQCLEHVGDGGRSYWKARCTRNREGERKKKRGERARRKEKRNNKKKEKTEEEK